MRRTGEAANIDPGDGDGLDAVERDNLNCAVAHQQ